VQAVLDEEGKFTFYTDASNFAFGVVLSQVQGEQEKVVAYAQSEVVQS